ncbi:MAG: ribbon-helix-helix protein, CopG family [Enhydrobacter sp.]|nr:ribbon-helix-helix protein, CopG family [Enhydrobacter sp.]
MKITLDIGSSRGKALDALAEAEKRSRSSIIREVIDECLARRRERARRDAFGLWRNHKVDGLDYQRKVRGTW